MKSKLFLSFLLFLSFHLSSYAQVGIGTTTPNASAELQVYSTTRGFLPPVMNQSQRNAISNPASGLMVYCSDCSPVGYYLYTNSSWVSIMNTDAQSISRSGLTVSLTNGGSFQDSVLNESAVDAMVANNGYLTSFTEVDGSVSNEIQDLSLSGTTLSLSGDLTTVDLSGFSTVDNLGNHTATQNLDLASSKLVGNGGTNGISIANDGKISLTSGANVNEFSTDGTLADNSDEAIPTEKAIKTYVDNNGGLISDGWGNHYGYNNANNLTNRVSGSGNVAIGWNAMSTVTTATDNIVIGNNALEKATVTSNNVVIGDYALHALTTGGSNTVLGRLAGSQITGGQDNVFVGEAAGSSVNLANQNTFVGRSAGFNASGSGSVFIGYNAGRNETTSNMLYIENSTGSTPLIGGDFSGNRVGINVAAANLNSGATLQVGGDISLSSGTSVNELSIDGTLAGNSDDAIPTEKAVKSYVDETSKLAEHDLGPYNYHSNTNNMVLAMTSGAGYNMAIGYNVLKALNSGDYNNGVGFRALDSLTTGSRNDAFGYYSMNRLKTGTYNTAVGFSSLERNESGNNNVAMGNKAGQSIKGNNNVIIGVAAGNGTTGNDNTFMGTDAGKYSQSNGSVFLGRSAGSHEDTDNSLYIDNGISTTTPLIVGNFADNRAGINTTRLALNSGATFQVGGDISLSNGTNVNEFSIDGTLAGNSDDAIPTEKAVKTYVNNNKGMASSGTGNYFGDNASNMLVLASGGEYNNAVGSRAMEDITTGDENDAFGLQTLANVNTGSFNGAFGSYALSQLTTGSNNLALGSYAGRNLAGASHSNVMVGISAGLNTNTSGGNFGNTFIGRGSGYNSNSDYSVFLGYNAGHDEDSDNMLYIENSNSAAPLIGGDFANNVVTVNTSIGALNDLTFYSNLGINLVVSGDAFKTTTGGWYGTSDRRLKTNINYLSAESTLQKVLQMKGITYEWNDTATGMNRPDGIQYGFVAQELQEIWPSKVKESPNGDGYLMTAYGDYDPMFVESIRALYIQIQELKSENEALKADKDSEVSELKAEMDALKSSLNRLEKLISIQNGGGTDLSP